MELSAQIQLGINVALAFSLEHTLYFVFLWEISLSIILVTCTTQSASNRCRQIWSCSFWKSVYCLREQAMYFYSPAGAAWSVNYLEGPLLLTILEAREDTQDWFVLVWKKKIKVDICMVLFLYPLITFHVFLFWGCDFLTSVYHMRHMATSCGPISSLKLLSSVL